MHSIIKNILFLTCLLLGFSGVFAQTAKPKRVSGVVIPVNQPTARKSTENKSQKQLENTEKNKSEEQAKAAAVLEKRRADAKAKEQAGAEAKRLREQAAQTERLRLAFEKKQKEENARQLAEEKLKVRQAEKEKVRAEKRTQAAELKAQKVAFEKENEAAREKIRQMSEKIKQEAELVKQQASANAAKIQSEREELERTRKNEKANREQAVRAAKLEAEQQLQGKINQAVETERQLTAQANRNALEIRQKARRDLILSIASKLKFLNAEAGLKVVPAQIEDAAEIERILKNEIVRNPQQTRPLNFCDRDFRGEDFRFELTTGTTLGSLIERIREYFEVNIIADAEIYDLEIRSNVGKLPWGSLLRYQLDFHDIMPRCEDSAIILMKREKYAKLQDTIAKTEPVRIEFIQLRYLQPTVSGTVDIAGKSSGNGSTAFNSLITQINAILRGGGDTRGSVAQIPGNPELIVTGTDKQISDIKEVIKRADKPSYQVVIYGLIYTANENKLRDIGGQVSVIGSANASSLLGGISNLGSSASGGANGNNGGGNGNNGTGGNGSSDNGNANIPGQLVPGGVRTFGNGFGLPSQNNPLIGATAIIGTVQFSAQLALLQQKGVVKIENRPMILVENGQTGQLKIGRQVAVPIQQVGLGGVGNTGVTILNAANTLNITPQVITDLNGNPVGVKLDTQIESNEVDTTVIANGIPSIQQRSAQTNFQINLGQTVIVGDFTTDADTDSETRTPGLASLPGIGYLFKRKVKSIQRDRLFFALRAEVVPVGVELNTVPLKLDTEPRIPQDDFFAPNNQPQVPVTRTKQP